MSKKREVNNLLNLNKYAIDVIQRLLDNKNICKLLTNTSIAPLQGDLPSGFEKEDLMWESVFPYKFIPDAEEYESCFIMVDYDDFRPNRTGDSVTNGYLLVDILCHENLMRMLGGTRTNALMGEINNTLNGERVSMGKLMFISMRQWHRQPRQYIGYTLAYRITDFNEWF